MVPIIKQRAWVEKGQSVTSCPFFGLRFAKKIENLLMNEVFVVPAGPPLRFETEF